MKSYRLQSQSEMSDLNAKINAEKAALARSDTSLSSETQETTTTLGENDYIQDLPRNSPYVGCSPTICHLLRQKRELCCLRLNRTCDHSTKTEVSDYKWKNKIIILASQSTNLAIYNFIVPLRSYAINKNSLNPILLLLENE